MKKIILIATTILLIVSVSIAIYAQSEDDSTSDNAQSAEMRQQLAEWEQLAEQGDTTALHRLIEFYDENSAVYVEVEAVCDADGTEWSQAEVDSLNNANKCNAELTKEYSDRLDYWLDKGTAMNDPVAIATKGMRLYYENEVSAINYLSKAAEAGNAQAALFCGSACLNQDKGEEAFKFLSMAYRLGAPSAGWHLAMCYSAGIGIKPDRKKAIEVMRHAARLNYPEAVSEMRRIEPGNKTWQYKADSLEIDFLDFPIIPDE